PLHTMVGQHVLLPIHHHPAESDRSRDFVVVLSHPAGRPRHTGPVLPSTSSRKAFAAWLSARRAGYTSRMGRSIFSSGTRTSHRVPCSISCSTHIRGRNATPSLRCTIRRIVSTVGISTSMFSGTL